MSPKPNFPPRPSKNKPKGDRPFRGGPRTAARALTRPAPEPLPPVDCAITLDEEGIGALAKRIRESRKAHPLFDVAHKTFQRPRALRFVLQPQSGASVQFHVCAMCHEPFLKKEAVIAHHFSRHADAIFSQAQIEVDPPKGNYAIVAFCGFCHEPICPPNFHKYTELLIHHHRRRHSRDRFDDFKSRIKMSHNTEDVEAWKKSQSIRQEFQCKLCEKKFLSRHEMMEHAGAAHADALMKLEDKVEVVGEKAVHLECSELGRVISRGLAQQNKMTPQLIGRLRHALNVHGLQFFRNAAGHQFINHIQPRRPADGELTDSLQIEILRLAAEPARRGHKPTHKTLVESFHAVHTTAPANAPASAPQSGPAPAAPPPATSAPPHPPAEWTLTEAQVRHAIDELVKRGFLVEYLDGELDAPAFAKVEVLIAPPVATTPAQAN